MGIFNKKPEPGVQVFNEYTEATGPWIERVQNARASGAGLTSFEDAVEIAGDVPALALRRLSGSYDRDRALYATQAWLASQADRLSRQDLLQGRDQQFWQDLNDALWSSAGAEVKQKPR